MTDEMDKSNESGRKYILVRDHEERRKLIYFTLETERFPFRASCIKATAYERIEAEADLLEGLELAANDKGFVCENGDVVRATKI